MLRLSSLKRYRIGMENEKGLTLIEMLVVIFVLGLLIPSLFNALSWTMKTSWNGVESQRSQEQFRIFNTTIIQELQYAWDIKVENGTDSDQISYTNSKGEVAIYRFEDDGLYYILNDEKIFIASGHPYEKDLPAVFHEKNGFVRFNFLADEINTLLFLSVKPRIEQP